jgi:hypothetical protein
LYKIIFRNKFSLFWTRTLFLERLINTSNLRVHIPSWVHQLSPCLDLSMFIDLLFPTMVHFQSARKITYNENLKQNIVWYQMQKWSFRASKHLNTSAIWMVLFEARSLFTFVCTIQIEGNFRQLLLWPSLKFVGKVWKIF